MSTHPDRANARVSIRVRLALPRILERLDEGHQLTPGQRTDLEWVLEAAKTALEAEDEHSLRVKPLEVKT